MKSQPLYEQGTDPLSIKRVLVIAYYFPPMGLSGVQRITSLVRHLPHLGWQPTVLTVTPRGYFAHDDGLLAGVHEAGASVERTRSLDPTAVFRSGHTVNLPGERRRRWFFGLSSLVFLPDNKVGWLPWAVHRGRHLLREHDYRAILSTAPPYTGHLIGAGLSRSSGVPLVADYRDAWGDNPRHLYPTRLHLWLHERLERRVLRQARHVTVINAPMQHAMLQRYPDALDRDRISIIPQGFDPEPIEAASQGGDKMQLLYTGVFYDAQTPDYFLEGLNLWLTRVPEARATVQACFAGLLPETSQRLVDALGLSDVVDHKGYLPHEAVRRLQKSADVLWMTIGHQPGEAMISTGKLYEYIGTRKPILGLVPDGTAKDDLVAYGGAIVVPPTDIDTIAAALQDLWERWRKGRLPEGDAGFTARFARPYLASQFADILTRVSER